MGTTTSHAYAQGPGSRVASTPIEELLGILQASRPAWMADGLCREPAYRDVDFFPERGAAAEPAKQVCARCLVADECRAFAAALPETTMVAGIWGGMSGRERRQHRRAALTVAKTEGAA